RARAGEVVDEHRLAERAVAKLAVDLFFDDVAPHAVDSALEVRPGEDARELFVSLRRLVHEQVVAARRPNAEDLGPQDGGEQAGIRFSDLGPEERRDEVFVAERELALDERARHLERRARAFEYVVVVRAAVDDLHVVDGDDGEPVHLRVEVRPRLEIADYDL